MRATSPRAATSAPSSLTRWAAKRPRVCSASTSTCSSRVSRTCRRLRARTGGPRRAQHVFTDGIGYFSEQTTRPQTIGYSLLDSPVGLAAWMLDHDTDGYSVLPRVRRRRARGQSHSGQHRRRHHAVLADGYRRLGRPVVLGGRTDTGRSGAAGQAPPAVSVPVGFTTSPGEVWAAPRSWVETVTLTSRTSTRSTAAATSPPGRSRSSSPTRCGPHSGHSGRTETPREQHRRDCDRHPSIPGRIQRGPGGPSSTYRGHELAEKETVADQSQGVPLAMIQELARYGRPSTTGASARQH